MTATATRPFWIKYWVEDGTERIVAEFESKEELDQAWAAISSWMNR